jgi:hypothetical protein
MHFNSLRLIRCDIFDFCKERFNLNQQQPSSNQQIDLLEQQAIQTAMSLYSNKLCALVLLVNDSYDDNKHIEDERDFQQNFADDFKGKT